MHQELTIMANRNELIDRLKENRENHEVSYQAAKKGFRIELQKELEKMLENVKAGKKVELYIKNRKPEHFTKKYDEAIEMLEFATSDDISLTTKQYRQFVKDDWDWKMGWSASNSSYLSAASLSKASQ